MMIMKTSLEMGPTLCFGFMGGPILIEDLGKHLCHVYAQSCVSLSSRNTVAKLK